MKILKTSKPLRDAHVATNCYKDAMAVFEQHGWDYNMIRNLKAGETHTWRVPNKVLLAHTHLQHFVENKRFIKDCLKEAIEHEWVCEHLPGCR